MTKRDFPYYAMSAEDLMALGEAELKALPQKDLSELSYFVWAFYSEDPEMMGWRDKEVLPRIQINENALVLPGEDDVDG